MGRENKKRKKPKILGSTMTRVVVVIIALVLPINIMTLLLSYTALQETRRQMDRDEQSRLEMVGGSVEDMLSRSLKKMLYLSLNDTDFITMARSNRTMTAGERGALLYSVRETLKDLRQEYDLIDYMYVCFPGQDFLIGDGSPGVNPNVLREAVRGTVSEEGTVWETRRIEDTNILWGRNSWEGAYFGVMLNLERTLRQLNMTGSGEGTCYLLTNRAETICVSGGDWLERQGMTLPELRASGRFEVYSCRLNNYDLVLTEVMEQNRLLSNLPATIVAMQIISVLLTLLVIPLLLWYISRRVRRPLNRLTKAMDRIEQGDLDYRIETRHEGREFEQLNRSFNQMMEQIQTLKIDVYEKELERKDIKMRYLSQQILPHFILNAMNILYSYEPEEYPLMQRLILCISKYFRYVVKVNATFVTVEQELDHIRNYFDIQRVRFPELFHSIVECGEDVKTALIPPLIVQNFAENAIKYSLKVGSEVTIRIKAERYDREDNDPLLRICLEDNGEGISDEVLEKIARFRETGEHQEGLGVGIENSIDRLRYLYQEDNRIIIQRGENDTGTRVELIMPLYFAEEGVDYGENFIGR